MSDTADPDFDRFLALAHTLADRSGETILPYFRAACDMGTNKN